MGRKGAGERQGGQSESRSEMISRKVQIQSLTVSEYDNHFPRRFSLQRRDLPLKVLLHMLQRAIGRRPVIGKSRRVPERSTVQRRAVKGGLQCFEVASERCYGLSAVKPT